MRLHTQQPRTPKYHNQYLVNNSFHPELHHKRVSFDTTLYCLVHKKMLRKAVIEQGFNESLTSFKHHSLESQKGFRGKSIPTSNIIQKKISSKTHYRISEEKRER